MKANNTIRLTVLQFIIMLVNWNKGAQPATIQYESTPKINKEGKSLFAGLFKLGAVNCIIDFDFEKSVNRQLIRENKEPDFKVKPLWNGKGKHINRRLIEHVETGMKYLAYKHERTLRSIYFDGALNFIPVALLKPYFYKSSKPKNQGTEKVINTRTLKIENIRKIKMLGRTYEIIKG